MKKLMKVAILLVLLLVSAVSVSASSNQLDYWEATYENKYEIGKFASKSITYSYQKLNNNNSFYFNESVVHATNEWAKALGITLKYNVLMQNANIKIYGGTVNDMYAMGLDINVFSNYPATLGVATHDRIYSYPVYDYKGQAVTNYTIRSAVVQMKDAGKPRSSDLTVMTHELGHALGWFEHSRDASLVMNSGYGTAGYNLTQRDINHLKQVYDK